MMISTKGRYALRVMTDLAEHQGQGFIPMKDVCARQGVSLKYLERILPPLTKAGLVDAVQGKGGGYRLNREPKDYSVWEILSAAEGDLAPVTCLSDTSPACERAAECRTLPLWSEYYDLSRRFFEAHSLADLLPEQEQKAR